MGHARISISFRFILNRPSHKANNQLKYTILALISNKMRWGSFDYLSVSIYWNCGKSDTTPLVELGLAFVFRGDLAGCRAPDQILLPALPRPTHIWTNDGRRVTNICAFWWPDSYDIANILRLDPLPIIASDGLFDFWCFKLRVPQHQVHSNDA